jgi:uncharacterized membrane protein YecN with MAPEG domain
MPEISLIIVALAAVMASALSMNVIFRRTAANVLIGDGGDAELQRRIRAHGNFVEHVPLALMALVAAESVGTAPATIWVLGLLLLTGRVAHVIAMLEGKLWPRPVGMGLTYTVTLVAAGHTLWALLG